MLVGAKLVKPKRYNDVQVRAQYNIYEPCVSVLANGIPAAKGV